MSIRLMVVDGQTLTRYALRRLVENHADIEIVGECASVLEAPALVSRLAPDVVTLDVAMPDGSGMTLARELRDRFGSLGIVLLTSHSEDDVLFRALDSGLSAFVPKTAPLVEILAAIRHASVAASSFTAAGLSEALARRRRVGDGLALSPRELEVLRLLHENMSIPAIARTLYVSQSTAKTYVARLYDKLDASSRAQALMTALHRGLIEHLPARPGDARPLPGQKIPGSTAAVRDRYPA
jgi:DNA-binding NarL/FixJ family response regulator